MQTVQTQIRLHKKQNLGKKVWNNVFKILGQ